MENRKNTYTEDSIKSLDWKEHIRTRPGMYIGKLGDGSAKDDGIYVLIKEVIDNSIDALLSAEKSNPNWLSKELGLDYYPIQVTLPSELQLSQGVGTRVNNKCCR